MTTDGTAHAAWRSLALPLLLAAFVLLTLMAASRESVTIDEFRHLSTGVSYWQGGDLAYDSATPPLWKMAFSLPAHLGGARAASPAATDDSLAGWGPWLTATDFMRANAAHYAGYLRAARIVNILAGVACLGLLYIRSRRRFGAQAALFATAFLAFSPTFLAHAHYATTDLIATLTLSGLVFLLIDQWREPRWRRLVALSLIFGVSLLCKFSALLVVPAIVTVLLLRAPRLAADLALPGSATGRTMAAIFLSFLLPLVTVLLLVNATYRFTGVGSSLAEIAPQSRALHAISQTPLGRLPLPLPRPFVEGFDHQKADSDYAEFPSYFAGRWSTDGFWYYYPAAFCLKETVPFILMLLLALFGRSCAREAPLERGEALLLWYLPATLLVVLSLFNRLDVGVRYLLPAYPLLCYLYSRQFAARSGDRRWRIALLWLLGLHLLSVLRVAPHYTAYFNELCGGPENGYRWLVDSNLDWGQDLPALKRYLEQHHIERIQLAYFGHALPEYYGIDYVPLGDAPRPGYVAISATLLQGQPYLLTYLAPPRPAGFDQFGFMRQYEPIAQVGHSMMIFLIR